MSLLGKRKLSDMTVLIFWAEWVISCSAQQKEMRHQGALWHLCFSLSGCLPQRFLRIFRCVKIRTHEKCYPDIGYFLMLLSSSKNLLIFSYILSPFAVQNLHLWRFCCKCSQKLKKVQMPLIHGVKLKMLNSAVSGIKTETFKCAYEVPHQHMPSLKKHPCGTVM